MTNTQQFKFTRDEVDFDADGVKIRGWLYRPSTPDPFPMVVMAHGFSLTKEAYLDKYAEVFARAGLGVVVFDFRNLGQSDGAPRGEINPWQQIEDYRHAITFATTVEGADWARIGVWGTSYSGAHSIVIGATDKRVSCVVAQVPAVSGVSTAQRRVPGEKLAALTSRFAEDRKARARGEPPITIPVVGEGTQPPAYVSAEMEHFFKELARDCPQWRNEITLRTLEWNRGYDAGTYIDKISPAPLLMIVGLGDAISGTDLQLAAYSRALEPKQLVCLKGGHFAPYVEEFDKAANSAADFFKLHLGR